MAHLMGDGAIGKGHREAVRVVIARRADGLAAGGQCVVIVAKQPAGVRRPGRALHIGAGATLSQMAPLAISAASLRCDAVLGSILRLTADRLTAVEPGRSAQMRIVEGQGG